MTIEIKVPSLPESVADATILNWHKTVGEYINRDEVLVELETDKVVLEVPSSIGGTVTEILQKTGSVVVGDAVLAEIEEGAQEVVGANSSKENSKKLKETSKSNKNVNSENSNLSPSVRRMVAESGIDPKNISGTGKDGRIITQDVKSYIEQGSSSQENEIRAKIDTKVGGKVEKRVPMSRLRAKIAERLVQSQQSSAMLTTFNEINMQEVMDVRAQHKDEFEKKYNVRLGFMSFFAKSVCEALKEFPSVNASIDGNDVVYHGFYDIGIAVSTERGLVVPVIRNVDHLGMADIESNILDFATRARENKISIDEMQGGTFTITNGGVFGSLLSTPIINPPQTAILGMHKIQERPVVENGEIVIRPMMYVAMSYDHRLIDGKESVQFLAMVKKLLEDPVSLMLGL